MMRWEGYTERIEKMRNSYKILDINLEGKRPHARRRSRWENNNKMDLNETGYEGVSCIHLAQYSNQ
jgi:hypothetical protein